MVYVGQKLCDLKIACPECSELASNRFPPASAFYQIICGNSLCSICGHSTLIEKASNCVIWTNVLFVVDDKPAYPTMLSNKEGVIVYEKRAAQ